jgi:hypothetical protein
MGCRLRGAILALACLVSSCGIEESDLVGTYDCNGCPTKEALELHKNLRLVWSVENKGTGKSCTYEGDWLYMTLADFPILIVQNLKPTDSSCTISPDSVEEMEKYHSVERPPFGKAYITRSGKREVKFVQP